MPNHGSIIPKSAIGNKTLPDQPHSFGCLLTILPESLSKEITDWALENIPDCHLGPEGREARPHCTICFGFRDSSESTISAVRSLLARHGPIPVRLTGLSLFRGGEDGDVLKVDVESSELHELNRMLRGSFDVEDKYEYSPHTTIAYLNPDIAESYLKESLPFLPRDVMLDRLEFSGADGERTEIRLGLLPIFGNKSGTSGLKVGDVVREIGGDKLWKIVNIIDVFGIPAADLIHIRRDGSEGVVRGRTWHNRPLSVLQKVKALSWQDETSGGTLVPPPRFLGKGRRLPVPLLRNKAMPEAPTVKKGTCKQGERADLTDCIPANGNGGAHPPAVQEDRSDLHKGDVSRALTDLASSAITAAKKAGHYEHLAKAWAKDRIGENVAKLPPKTQTAVKAVWWGSRIGVKYGLFAIYTAGQKAAELTARANGATEEQAKRIRGICAAIDLNTFEVFKVGSLFGIHAAHIPMAVTGLVPVGSAGYVVGGLTYLVYSQAKDPLVTANKARKAIHGIAKRLGLSKGLEGQGDVLQEVWDYLHGTEGDADWRMALLMAGGLDTAGDLPGALRLAKEADSTEQQRGEKALPVPPETGGGTCKQGERADLTGCVPTNGGSTGNEPTKTDGVPLDDPVSGYIDGFNDPNSEPASLEDVNQANKELEEEESNYRIVPGDGGKFEAVSTEELEDQYGEDWTVAVNPQTGKLEVASQEWFDQLAEERGDDISAPYVDAFNDPGSEPATKEDAVTANREMKNDGSDYRIKWSKVEERWIAVLRKKGLGGYERKSLPSRLVTRQQQQPPEEDDKKKLDEAFPPDRRIREDGWEERLLDGEWLVGDQPDEEIETLGFGQKGGFTGVKKDKLGREFCWEEGKRVPCGGGADTPDPKKDKRRQDWEARQAEEKERLSQPAKVTWVSEAGKKEVEKIFAEGGFSSDDVPRLVGAPPGSEVSISQGNYGAGIGISVNHPHIKDCARTLKVDFTGKLTMYNQMFFLQKAHRGSGMGLQVFSEEVRACADLGVDKIETCAGKGGIMNGYYTWPTLGYDAPLDEGFLKQGRFIGEMTKPWTRKHDGKTRPALTEEQAWSAFAKIEKAESIQDLMETAEGREYWYRHGTMEGMTFDCTPGSRSLQVLNGKMKAAGKPPIEPDPEKVKDIKERREGALKDFDAKQKAKKDEEDTVTMRSYFRGSIASAGLDADELDRAAEAQFQKLREYQAMNPGTQFGTTDPVEIRRHAWQMAASRMVAERHRQRMAAPELADVRQDLENSLVKKGVDVERVRGIARELPFAYQDAVAAIGASYRAAAKQIEQSEPVSAEGKSLFGFKSLKEDNEEEEVERLSIMADILINLANRSGKGNKSLPLNRLIRIKALPDPPKVGIGTCKQGERADLTGCVPASGEEGKVSNAGNSETEEKNNPIQDLAEKFPKNKEGLNRVIYVDPGEEMEGLNYREEETDLHQKMDVLAILPGGVHVVQAKEGVDPKELVKDIRRDIRSSGVYVRPMASAENLLSLYENLTSPVETFTGGNGDEFGVEINAKKINDVYYVADLGYDHKIVAASWLKKQDESYHRYQENEAKAEEKWKVRSALIRAKIKPEHSQAVVSAVQESGGSLGEEGVKAALTEAGIDASKQDDLLKKLVYIGDIQSNFSGGKTWYTLPQDKGTGQKSLLALPPSRIGTKAWQERDHPRVGRGKPGAGRFGTGGGPGAHAKVKERKLEHAHKLIADIRGGKSSPKLLAGLANHLASLTVTQLKGIKKSHNIPEAKGRLKAQLVASLAEHLSKPGSAIGEDAMAEMLGSLHFGPGAEEAATRQEEPETATPPEPARIVPEEELPIAEIDEEEIETPQPQGGEWTASPEETDAMAEALSNLRFPEEEGQAETELHQPPIPPKLPEIRPSKREYPGRPAKPPEAVPDHGATVDRVAQLFRHPGSLNAIQRAGVLKGIDLLPARELADLMSKVGVEYTPRIPEARAQIKRAVMARGLAAIKPPQRAGVVSRAARALGGLIGRRAKSLPMDNGDLVAAVRELLGDTEASDGQIRTALWLAIPEDKGGGLPPSRLTGRGEPPSPGKVQPGIFKEEQGI